MINLTMPKHVHSTEPLVALPEGFNPADIENMDIDALEAKLVALPQLTAGLVHSFTPGMYIRECFTPAGSLFTSRIHRTEHPFNISMGLGQIWLGRQKGWAPFMSPYKGTTKPGTRRVVMIFEDTICTTYHANPTDETDPEKLEALLYVDHDGPAAHLLRLRERWEA